MEALRNRMQYIRQSAPSTLCRFLWIPVLLLAPLAGMAEDNLYAQNYQPQNQGNLHSLQADPEPQLFSGNRRDEDNIKMLENGYDLMGLSSFEGGDIPPQQAIDHGRNIKADAILVYVKKAGNATAASKMEMIKEAVKKGQALTEKDMVTAPEKYRYYATFWAKLPPPVLGVHVIKLIGRKATPQGEQVAAPTPSEGVRIIAVIHDSPAEKAGLQRGDQLLSINQEKINDAATLSALVRRLRGDQVSVQIERQNEAVSLNIQL